MLIIRAMINKIKRGKEQNEMIGQRAIRKGAVIGELKRKFNKRCEALCVRVCVGVCVCVCVFVGKRGEFYVTERKRLSYMALKLYGS